MKRLVALLFLCSVFGVACNLSIAGCRNTTNLPPNVLFRDDFSNSSCGWDSARSDDGSTGYDNGTYHITVHKTQYDMWGNTNSKLNFNDAHIEVDATRNSGPDTGDFGIICRYQDTNNFYQFMATSDGYYGILVVKGGTQTELASSDAKLQQTGTINKGATAKNHLRADCVGNTLTLYINGTQVASVNDSTFSSGDVGLFAGTFNEPDSDFSFDNFEVQKP